MLRRNTLFLWAGMSLIFMMLTACGGSDNSGAERVNEVPDLTLASLNVNAGGQTLDFNPRLTGPYDLTVESAVTEVTITPTASADDVQITVAKLGIETASNGVQFVSNRIDEISVSSGDTDTRTLDDGYNSFSITVKNRQHTAEIEYRVRVYRASTDPALDGFFVNFPAAAAVSEAPVVTPNTFSVDTKEYSMEVPYRPCSMILGARPAKRGTTVSINGSSIVPSASNYLDIAVGSNTFTFDTLAEDGETADSYTLTVERAAPTEDDLNTDASLAELSFSTGELDNSFSCHRVVYVLNVNDRDQSIEVTATPTVAGATMKIGDYAIETTENDSGTTTTRIVPENEVDLAAGVPFTIDLESGFNDKIITVFAVNHTDDAEEKLFYRVGIVRRSTNLVEVSTAEELQTALKTAEAGDEISIAAGTYLGTASVEASGDASAHFYSDRSGTEEDPIILTSASSSNTASLEGGDRQQNSVLNLTGDYWVVDQIKVSGANKGILLDSSSNNILRELEVSNIGAQGIHFRNGSADNILIDSSISDTGAEALVIGSDDSEWSSAPEGSYAETDNNNSVRNTNFGKNILAEHVDIKEGTVGNVLEFNTFDSHGISTAAEDLSVISIKGNDVTVRYNTFFHQNGEGLSQFISSADPSEDWHTQSWGENIEIYQNRFSLNGADLPLVNGTSSDTLWVADNTRDDEGQVRYTDVDEMFSTPVYQIQIASDSSLCLGLETRNVVFNDHDGIEENDTEGELEHALVVEACSDANDQQWLFRNDTGGYVQVTNLASEDRIMGPFFFIPSESTTIGMFTLDEDNPSRDGFLLRWRLNFEGDVVQISTKFEDALVLSVALTDSDDTTLEAGDEVLLGNDLNLISQQFRLVRQ